MYERNELIQLALTNRNPRCVITGRPITETEEQINALPTAIQMIDFIYNFVLMHFFLLLFEIFV